MKLLLSLLLMISVGCADNNDDNNDNVVNNPAADPGNNNATTVPELIGTWSKPCVSIGVEGFRKSVIAVQNTNNTMQLQELAYQSNSTCEGVADIDTRANFTFTAPAFASGQVNSVDMTLQQVLAKINTTNGVTLANTAGLCGFNDWQVGVDKDVSGRNCIVTFPNAGEPFYQIVRVAPTELFVGKIDSNRTGRTPETRPTELEPEPYRR